jgi:hypothetical protein
LALLLFGHLLGRGFLFSFVVGFDVIGWQFWVSSGEVGFLVVLEDEANELIFFYFFSFAVFLFSMDEAFISILDHVLIFFILQAAHNFGPLLPLLKDLFQQDDVLFWLPLALHLVGVQTVQPPFTALLCIAEVFLFASAEELL